MVRRCDLRRRQRSRKSKSTRMKAKPASPPTTPPTTAGVFIELPPPEPAPEVAEDDGAEAVLLEPPMPPITPPVLDTEVVGLNVEVCELEAVDENEVVPEAIELPELEERSVLEERLETPDEVEDTLLVKVERDLVAVMSVLFALKLENIGFVKEDSVEVVLAPDWVGAMPCG